MMDISIGVTIVGCILLIILVGPYSPTISIILQLGLWAWFWIGFFAEFDKKATLTGMEYVQPRTQQLPMEQAL